MQKVAFIIDGICVLLVDEDKMLLTRELINHMTPRWQEMARKANAKNKPCNVSDYICALLETLFVPHEVYPYPIYLSILETTPDNELLSEGKAATEGQDTAGAPETPAEAPVEAENSGAGG